MAPMFQPLKLREMEVANRAVVSPMCMYSAKEGVPGDFHLVHYGSRAIGGAGLIFTEMTCVGRDARITPGCTGLWNDEQQAAWTRIVDFVHANSAAKICLQLGHAGRKGATKLMWEGMDRPLEQGGWDTISASPLPYFPDSQVPREMDRAAMDRVKARVRRRRPCAASACGFDMLELHCAHGYLLASFISPLTNQRTDEYGGTLANRLRYPLEIFEAMRAAWPAHKPMSVRISATDWAEGGITGDDAVMIARAFAEAGVDLVDVSTGQTVRDAQPIYGRMFQTPFSEQVRNEARVATMCVGNITTARSGQYHPRRRPRRSGGARAGRIWWIRRSRCGRRPGTAHPILPARRNICPARSRYSATACATGRISRTSKLRVSRKPGPSSRRRRQSRLQPNRPDGRLYRSPPSPRKRGEV